jgi:hypothetical protein
MSSGDWRVRLRLGLGELVTQRDFDIWLHGFPRETREAPPLAISRVFGIPVQAAEALVATLPRVVKRDASPDQAERLVYALESIGGVAEAIPTRVVPAPVLVVGTQPAHLKPETLVRHAPRSGALREHPVLDSAASGSETLKVGTHELAAYHAGAVVAAYGLATAAPESSPLLGSPDATLVDSQPPRWDDAELARADQGAVLAQPEPRGRWDDLELAPPDQLAPPISLLPPPAARSKDMLGGTISNVEITRDAHSWLEKVGQGPIPLTPLSSRPPPASDQSWITLTPHPVGIAGSEPPGAWKNPMALPPRDTPLRSLGMRTPAERMRTFNKGRSIHPPSIRPSLSEPEPSFTDALMALSRGDFRGATNASPTLSFAVILVGVTLAFMVAYAAW